MEKDDIATKKKKLTVNEKKILDFYKGKPGGGELRELYPKMTPSTARRGAERLAKPGGRLRDITLPGGNLKFILIDIANYPGSEELQELKEQYQKAWEDNNEKTMKSLREQIKTFCINKRVIDKEFIIFLIEEGKKICSCPSCKNPLIIPSDHIKGECPCGKRFSVDNKKGPEEKELSKGIPSIPMQKIIEVKTFASKKKRMVEKRDEAEVRITEEQARGIRIFRKCWGYIINKLLLESKESEENYIFLWTMVYENTTKFLREIILDEKRWIVERDEALDILKEYDYSTPSALIHPEKFDVAFKLLVNPATYLTEKDYRSFIRTMKNLILLYATFNFGIKYTDCVKKLNGILNTTEDEKVKETVLELLTTIRSKNNKKEILY